jgi:Uma2 family endonuclease
MSVALKHPPARMTVDEFLQWDSGDYSGRRWQLVDGEPMAMAPAAAPHGTIQAELARLIGNHLIERASPGRVLTKPGIIPQVRARENFRIPDLAVTCASPTKDVMVEGCVLLAEILSPNNYAETRANIWAYTTIPSVQEIVVLHSTRIEAELLRRRPDGSWPAEPEVIQPPGTLDLASIGFSAPVAEIYRTSFLAG